MTREDMNFVQGCINYNFKNLLLLEQAFTRKSYANEHPEVEDNEVLEFYGDEVLDFVVTKELYKQFSKIVKNYFVSDKKESELTQLKSLIVSKESLSRCMKSFCFSDFLYLGKSDEQNDVKNSDSVNEDLFEAIIGAVAVDCNWEYSVLEKVCKTMLQMENYNILLEKEVEAKAIALGLGEPRYFQEPVMIPFGIFCFGSLAMPRGFEENKRRCLFYLKGVLLEGWGDTEFFAKYDAVKQAHQFLCKEEIKRKLEKLDFENPVSTLHELFQKKIIHEVFYDFSEYHDENGNPIWRCKASLEGYEMFCADNASKKYAKQSAALKLLKYITEERY